ncbi:hypothetical protein JG636_16930 [Vibrio cholerae]|nr:hypothetical protein [Vibrio cholerae]EGR1452283.1 hypothetical protein [Vibrio cholerae]EGR2041098.1 hypothetical protein [Vibrio cholerae]EGR2064937.1 hypothetical protein [Vibrio cholerae]EGR2116121.1 hypothetical protein [Vibrio cholerae]
MALDMCLRDAFA